MAFVIKILFANIKQTVMFWERLRLNAGILYYTIKGFIFVNV